MSPKASALQCQLLVKDPLSHTINLITQEQKQAREDRRALEDSLHERLGSMSFELHTTLTELFGLRKAQPSPLLMRQLRGAFLKDPIASRLTPEAQNKIIWLVHQRLTPPYIAFLLQRYVDSITNSSRLSFEDLQEINKIINSYIYERALLISRRKLRERPHPENEQSILEYVTGESVYNPGYLNYNKPSRFILLSSIFKDILREVENELASEPAPQIY
ncbi:MAG: hypothetical protein ACRBBP_02565 [Bdellovibrionales bacterium]